MNKALFSFGKENLSAQKTTLPDKGILFEKMRDRGIHPIINFRGEAAFDAKGVLAYDLVDDHRTREFGHVALENIGVIINRFDRSFRHKPTQRKEDGVSLPYLPEAWQQAEKPTVNESAMRSLAYRKARVQDEILAPFGLGMPTLLIGNIADVEGFVEENPSESYIVKPNSGTGSKGVKRVTADQAIALFAAGLPEKDMVIQPKYDFTHPFDNQLKPYDTLSNEAFEGWSKSNEVKELRMYSFYSPSIMNMFPVARAMKDGIDHWFFVDPESVPEQLYVDTYKVVSRAADVTNSRAVYAALDFGYGAQNAESKPGYHVVELNGKMPYLVGSDKHAGVAGVLRDYFADQIKDAAKHRDA